MLTVSFDKKTRLECRQDRIPDRKKKVTRKKDYSECPYLPQNQWVPYILFFRRRNFEKIFKDSRQANRDSISVMYNLAIAKIALQV